MTWRTTDWKTQAAAVAGWVFAIVAALLAGCAQPPQAPPEARIVAAMREHSVVLLGEVHDNAGQHALRARTLREWLAAGARPAVLMEQFDRERQGDIDRVRTQPGATADDIIAAAAPPNAGWDWALYKPLIALALEYRLPLIAANVSRDDTRRVLQGGLASLGFDPAVPADIMKVESQEIADSHCGMIDATQAEHMVPAQEARDQFMARLVAAHADGVVLLAGNGHVRRDVGVPRWLPSSTRAHSVSIGLLEEGTQEAGAFDIAIVTPAQQRPDPCEAFRGTAKP